MSEYLNYLSFGNGGWAQPILSGALLTIEIAVATLPFGLVMGLLLASGMLSNKKWVQRFCIAYGTIFRALPELLTILLSITARSSRSKQHVISSAGKHHRLMALLLASLLWVSYSLHFHVKFFIPPSRLSLRGSMKLPTHLDCLRRRATSV